MGAHEGSTRLDGDEWGWDCRCGDTGTGFPDQGGAEDDLRIHLALSSHGDDRTPLERLVAFASLYHPASVIGDALRRAVRIARGDEPLPTAVELTAEERAAASIPRRPRTTATH